MENRTQLKLPPKWLAGLQIAWQRLTRPSALIQDETKHYKAKLLSSLLLIIFTVQAILVVFCFAVTMVGVPQSPRFVALLATGILYLLSRTKYYEITAALVILYTPVGVVAIILSGNSPIPEAVLMFMLLSLFLGNILLSAKDVLRLGIINITFILLLSLFVSQNLPHINLIPAIITFHIIATFLVIASRIVHQQDQDDRLVALKRSEERFRQLAENLHQAFWIAAPDPTHIEYVSPIVEQVWGCSASDFYENPQVFLQSIHPDDLEKIVKPRLAQQAAGEQTSYEYRIIRPDGATRWIWDRGFPLKDEMGKVYRVLGIAEDITERKQVAAEFEASRKFLEATQAVAKIGSWEFDPINQTSSWSPQMYEIYERDPALGAPTIDEYMAMIHPDDQALVRTTQAGGATSGERQGVDFRIQLPDGRIKYIYATVSLQTADAAVPKLIGTAQDITERKQKEMALRQSEERFSKLFSANPDALFLSRVDDGLIVEVNKNIERLFGYQQAELVGHSVLELNLYANNADRSKLLAQLQQQGSLRDYEVKGQTKAGEPRTLQVSMEVLELDDTPHILATARDITKQKEVEIQLAYHAYILENLAEGLNYVDQQGIIRFTNPAFDAMFGYERGELLGQPISIVNDLPAAENEQLVATIHTALQEVGLWSGEFVNRKKDGTSFITSAKIQAITLGEQSYWVTFQEDITERKRTEEALRESEERYRALYNNTPAMMYSIDIERRLVSVSDYWLEMMGYERDEVIGLPAPSFLTEASQQYALQVVIPHLFAIGQIKDVPYQFVKKGGEVIDVLLSAVIENDKTGQFRRSMAVLVDVTERNKLENKLRHAQKMEAVGHLTAGIAHDFNNLLTAITVSAELIEMEIAVDDPLMTKVERIMHASQLAATLISRLMIFSHKQIAEPEWLNLNEVVNSIEKLLQRIIGEHIVLETTISADLWPIKIDRSQLEQVIVNLAVNARDAMAGGGQLIIQTNNIKADEHLLARGILNMSPGDSILLTVRDTGIGMSQAVQAQIFEPFFTTKGVGRGTGLGLATVYNIVKENGGDIHVESAEGQGATFKIYLPRTEKNKLPNTVDAEVLPLPLGDEMILLVEDDEGVRMPIADVLQRHGYVVIEARNGLEALRLASNYGNGIDLLVTDVVMPGISGKDVVDRLSQQLSNLKVLYVSGYSDEEISQHGVLNSGHAFLQKPFDFKSLLHKVRQVLDEPA